eukprot:jgi/Mesen1/1964/ME000147S01051
MSGRKVEPAFIELSFDTNDSLIDEKKAVLDRRCLSLRHEVTELTELESTTAKLLEAARILELTETELYFLEEAEGGPHSPRNEAQALFVVLSAIRQQLPADHPAAASWQASLQSTLDSLGASEEGRDSVGEVCTGEAELRLCEWAKEQGICSSVVPADFVTTGRGAAAAQAMAAGDVVVRVPERLLLCSRTALASDIGPLLSSINGLDDGALSLLWTMRERHLASSPFAPFFASLPEAFSTGLSMGPAALAELQGTLLLEELLASRQYDALFPALSHAHPDAFPPERCTWAHFMWAAQLWYSHGLRVRFPDGRTQACLIPMANLLNHSVYPHATHFSKVEAASRCLIVRALAGCARGRQCFLSYGALSDADLLLFYGFVVAHPNPYDTVPIELELPEEEDDELAQSRLALLERHGLGLDHMVRACTHGRGLPPKLLAALRVLSMEADELASYGGNPLRDPVSKRNEVAALEALDAVVSALLQMLLPAAAGDASDQARDSLNSAGAEEEAPEDPAALAAFKFKKSQLMLLQSVHDACMSALLKV